MSLRKSQRDQVKEAPNRAGTARQVLRMVAVSATMLGAAACGDRLPPPHACLTDSLPPSVTVPRRWQPYAGSNASPGDVAYRLELHSRWSAMDDGAMEFGDTLQPASIWAVPGEGVLSLTLGAAPPPRPGLFLSAGDMTECGVSWANWDGRVAVSRFGTEKHPTFVIRGVWPIDSGRWGYVVGQALSVRAAQELLAGLRTLAPDTVGVRSK
jgi:hypothetical protein